MRKKTGFPLWTYFGVLIAAVSIAVSTVLFIDSRNYEAELKRVEDKIDSFTSGQKLQDLALLDIHLDIQKLFDAIFGTGKNAPVPLKPERGENGHARSNRGI